MSWFADSARVHDADSAGGVASVVGLTPAVGARYHDLAEAIWASEVSPVVLELCRLRIATLLGCERELAVRTPLAAEAGLDDDKVAALSQWPTSPRFDASERACLSFAECYVIDAHSITDEQCAELNRHFSPPQLAAFTTALAFFDASARLRVALDV